MTRKIVFKKTSDPEIISHIQKGATEVKPMFGRKAFALEIKQETKNGNERIAQLD